VTAFSAEICTKAAGGDLTVGKRTKQKTAGGKRSGAGKVKFLTVLPAADIKTIKLRAIERGRGVTASEILEEAVSAWLKLNRGAKPRALVDDVPASEKHQFLSQMDAKFIKQLKVMALDSKVTASALVREAVTAWLSQNDQLK
jgi:Arc/MetJ-type ribon-helix-helix transcriptional regulator